MDVPEHPVVRQRRVALLLRFAQSEQREIVKPGELAGEPVDAQPVAPDHGIWIAGSEHENAGSVSLAHSGLGKSVHEQSLAPATRSDAAGWK